MSVLYDLKLDLEDMKKQLKRNFDTNELVREPLESKIEITSDNLYFETEIKSFPFEITIEEIEINLDFSRTKAIFFEKAKPVDEEIQTSKEELKIEILDMIKQNPKILTSEIVDSFNIDTWAILDLLDELKDEGLVE